jgi:hypothetical protein
VSQLDTEESSSVGGHSTSKGRTKSREECLDTTLSVEFTNDATNGDVALRGLQTRLDRIDGEDRYPHGNSSGSSSACDSTETELAAGLSSEGINRCHLSLDVLVGGKVGSRTGAVTGESSSAAAEDAADTALLVELADDVNASVILGLLAGSKLLLTLDLEDDLDALEGCCVEIWAIVRPSAGTSLTPRTICLPRS